MEQNTNFPEQPNWDELAGDNPVLRAGLERAWDRSKDVPLQEGTQEQVDTAAAWENVLAGMRKDAGISVGNGEGGRRYSGGVLRGWVGYVTIATFCLLGVKYLPNVADFGSPSNSAFSQVKTYTTTNARRANIILPDGSNIILAPATTIRVDGRNVELTGEAVFTVSPDRGKSFTVKAGNSVTRVLGTTFGVRAYPSDKSVRVAVAVGRVSVASAVLSAGDVATISEGAKMPRITSGTDMSSAFAWTSGRIDFDNILASDAVRDLDRWYNVHFVLADSILAKRYVTISLNPQDIAEAVKVLSAILNARAEHTGSSTTQTITFHAR